MKLYEVEFTVKSIVAAESMAHATLVADSEWRDIKSETPDDDVDIFINKRITELSQLAAPWDGDCIPYGSIDKRIKDYL